MEYAKKRRGYIGTIVLLLMYASIISITGTSHVKAGGDGTNLSSAPLMGEGKKIKFDVPNGGDNVDFVGVLIKRYQPTSPNSENVGAYTDLVKMEGKEEWFVGKDHGTQSGQFTKYEIKYGSGGTTKALFSDYRTVGIGVII